MLSERIYLSRAQSNPCNTFFFLVKPLQVKAPSSLCNVEGQTFDDGDSMEVYSGDLDSGECHQCTCKEGKLIDCHHIFHCVLNDSSCNSYSKTPGQCCPTCERGTAESFVSRQQFYLPYKSGKEGVV